MKSRMLLGAFVGLVGAAGFMAITVLAQTRLNLSVQGEPMTRGDVVYLVSVLAWLAACMWALDRLERRL